MNNAPFYIGQEVVVVRDHSQGIIKKGQEVEVLNIKIQCCEWIVDIGISSSNCLSRCACGNVYTKTDSKYWFSHTMFAPKLDLSETTVEEFIENMDIAEYHTLDI